MKLWSRSVAVILLATFACWAQQDSGTLVRSGTREVLVEMSVRDKHGKTVKSLSQADVAVYEDGVRRDVQSFRLVSGGEVREDDKLASHESGSAFGQAAGLNSLKPVNLVCLVFGNIQVRTRATTFEAAQKFVNAEVRPNTFIGVFLMDHGTVRQISNFSNNRNVLLKGLGSMRDHPNAMAAGFATSVAEQNGNGLATDGPPVVVQSSGAASYSNVFGNRGELDYQATLAQNDLDTLRSLVQGLSKIPYRKSVVLFIGNLAKTADDADNWSDLIDKARRASITFYGWSTVEPSVDYDPLEASRQALNYAAQLSAGQSKAMQSGAADEVSQKPANSNFGAGGGGQDKGATKMDSMRQTDFTRYAATGSNWQQAATDLTTSTGGFFIDNTTNTDLLKRVMDDVDTRYEVSFRPGNDVLDGKYHKIEIKFAKRDFRAETREGYYAVSDEESLTAADVAGLHALNSEPKPHAFEFNSKAYWFRQQAGGQYSIVFDVPVGHLTATAVPNVKRHRFHAVLFAVVRNAQGEIVGRFSKDVNSEVGDEFLAQLQNNSVTFEHPFVVPADAVSIEAAVVDEEGNRSSVNEIAIRQDPKALGHLAMSDLVLAKRAEDVSGTPDGSDPFELGGKRLVPTLAEKLAPKQQMILFLYAYPAQPDSGKLGITMQVERDGRTISNKAIENLPPVDQDGRVPIVAGITTVPGSYRLTMTAVQGAQSAKRVLAYSVAEK